jgi:hypothetical protein
VRLPVDFYQRLEDHMTTNKLSLTYVILVDMFILMIQPSYIMKILKRFLTVVNTVLFLTLSTNLPTFAQEKYFGINPIPNDYLEMGAGMSLQDKSGNIVFSSNYKYCDDNKPCYVMDVYGQLITVSPVFRHGDNYEKVVLANKAQSLLVTLELNV